MVGFAEKVQKSWGFYPWVAFPANCSGTPSGKL